MPRRTASDAATLFENELRRRGASFSIDPASGRYDVLHGAQRLSVGLDNFERELSRSLDPGYVTYFVDTVLGATNAAAPDAHSVYWVLEQNGDASDPTFSAPVSPRLDRVLAHVPDGGELVMLLTAASLDALHLDLRSATELGYANLNRRLAQARLQVEVAHGVPVGYLQSDFVPKASLILAPALAEVVRDQVGWPVQAIAPTRDFLMIWPAASATFLARMEHTAVSQFTDGPYPLSAEVLEVGDSGVRAIGEFRTG